MYRKRKLQRGRIRWQEAKKPDIWVLRGCRTEPVGQSLPDREKMVDNRGTAVYNEPIFMKR